MGIDEKIERMIDLKEFAEPKGYKLSLDESWYSGCGEPKKRYWQIKCKYGVIYPTGENTLGAYTDHVRVIPRLLALGSLAQRGDDDASILFDPARLAEVGELLHAKRKRRMSEEQRAATALRLSQYSFKKNTQLIDSKTTATGVA